MDMIAYSHTLPDALQNALYSEVLTDRAHARIAKLDEEATEFLNVRLNRAGCIDGDSAAEWLNGHFVK